MLGAAENLSLRVNGLIDHIAELRRELFAHFLTKRYDINYALIGEVADDFYSEGTELLRTVTAWVRFVFQFKLRSVLIATFLRAACGGGPADRRAAAVRSADRCRSGDRKAVLSQPAVGGVLVDLLPTAAVTGFLATTYFLYDYFSVLRPDIATMMTTLFIVIGVVFFVQRLAKAVLSPRLPNWRLIAVETRAARLLAVAGVRDRRLHRHRCIPELGLPGARLAADADRGGKPDRHGADRHPGHPDGPDQALCRRGRRAAAMASAAARRRCICSAALTIVAALLGYIGFARFMSMQMVFTGAILSTMYIGFLSARAVSEEGAFGRTAVGRRLERSFKLDPTTLDQLALVVEHRHQSADRGDRPAADPVHVGLPARRHPGLDLQIRHRDPHRLGHLLADRHPDAASWSSSSSISCRAGSAGWLDGSVLARGRVDAGVRNSIRTAVGYAGILLAALLGVSAAGIDMSNLALVAGALSLGIGFGLQNIVSNFVSGLILLAERPFKVGDWVVAGTNSGMVKKISVRATEIETFQRQTVIVPNSEFINSAVGNWTHRNKLGRIDVKINVAYGTDARRAAEVMDAVVRSHPLVLKNPEPFVVFLNFGPAALEFELRFFLADILNANVVQNDIRFAILETFERERIEIPSNPRAVDPRFAEQPRRSRGRRPRKRLPPRRNQSMRLAAAKAKRRRPDPE